MASLILIGKLLIIHLLVITGNRTRESNRTKTDNRIFCSDYRLRENYTFHPLRHCQRSNSSQISATNVDSFEKCSDFAKSVKALALNYGRFNTTNGAKNLFEVAAEKKLRKGLIQQKSLYETLPSQNSQLCYLYCFPENNYTIYTSSKAQVSDLFNCEALACPETTNFSTIVNDTRYDYYSLYTNPVRK